MAKPKLLPPLDQAHFKEIVHWHPHEYRKLRRQTAGSKPSAAGEPEDSEAELPGLDAPKKKEPAVPSCFLEDKNGNPIPDTEKRALLSMASGFWQHLQDNDRAPKTFQKLNLELRLQWQLLMESNFECLRYCDAHWKVTQIWINYYPSWLMTARREKAKAEKMSGLMSRPTAMKARATMKTTATMTRITERSAGERTNEALRLARRPTTRSVLV